VRNILTLLRVAPLVVVTATVVACGGGYGSSSQPPMQPPPPAAKSTVTVGAITGFGSTTVSLNGMQFQAGGASVSIDSKGAQVTDLHTGDMVQVKGHHDSDTDEDVADEIDFHGNVQGPVSAIDTTAQTLVVLGQTIVVSADTSFDDNIAPASLAGVHVSELVEVSGMVAADGSIAATRIAAKAAGSPFLVLGTTSATDSVAKTLNINALVVEFSGAALSGFASTGPADGELIAVTGTTIESNGALQATRLELLTSEDMRDDQDDAARVEGLITRFASASDFDVAGHPAATSASTQFDGGTAADLALDVHVEVEGTIDAAGVLEADEVRIAKAADVRITAQVDAVDAGAETLTLLGIQVSVDAMTRFDEHQSRDDRSFSLAEVQVGQWLEVRGAQSGAGSNMVTAMRLERQEPQSRVRLMGPVNAATAPNFTLLSTAVATTATTEFSGIDSGSFFATAVGRIVSVRGTWDGSTLTAGTVQLGDDHEGDDGGDD
jgi:cytoskeletal protein CcmA (bactofilin family)